MFVFFKQQFSYIFLVLPFLGGSSPTTNDNRKWRYGMDRCKSNGVYLMGKINLTDIVSACKSYTNSPGWIGVVKENYTSFDQGKGKQFKTMFRLMYLLNMFLLLLNIPLLLLCWI